MAARLNQFEQFLSLFSAVEEAAKGEPRRITTFWGDSPHIRKSVNDLEDFLRVTDFERRTFQGNRKFWPQTPDDFEKIWRTYKRDWEPFISRAYWDGVAPELDRIFDEMMESGRKRESASRSETVAVVPDPEVDTYFHPMWHDGAGAIELGLRVIENELNFREPCDDDDRTVENMCRLGLGAHDYLTGTIGLDISGAFRRWRKVPTTFVPTHVSNQHGLTEKGSLYDLLNDAVRAYVFGAPAASVAMCRAALEMILKRHYCAGAFAPKDDLADIIVLASKRFNFLDQKELDGLRQKGNKILHDYGSVGKLSEDDERTIQQFLRTLKYLIQRAPN